MIGDDLAPGTARGDATGIRRVNGSPAVLRRAGMLAGVTGFGIAGLIVAHAALTMTVQPVDAITYLAAGERLNAGHPLYGLAPGDRPIALNPPYWSVPLLSPPLIAVLWRPLAQGPLGLEFWWIVAALVVLIIGAWLLAKAPVVAGPAILAVSAPIAWQIADANVNAFIFAGTVAVWALANAGRIWLAASVVTLMASIKLWPAVLCVWLISTFGRRALLPLLGGGVFWIAISVGGAGLAAHIEYIHVAVATPFVGLGTISPFLPLSMLLVGVGLIVLMRDQHALTFGIAITTMILASPILGAQTFVVLLASLTPLAMESDDARRERILEQKAKRSGDQVRTW